MKPNKIFRLAVIMAFVMVLLLAVMPSAYAATTYQAGDVFALLNAINTLADGDTIQLTADISLPGNNFASQFDGKNVTFDLNGHNFNIGGIQVGNTSAGVINIVNTNAGAGGAMTVNSYLNSLGGSMVTSSGAVLNVNGQVTASGVGSSVTVNNVSNNSYGVSADSGGKVTVNGDLTVNTGYSAVYAVSANGSGSSVTVNGNIAINGSNCYGAYISNSSVSGADITINGSITANGSNSNGIYIQNSTGAAISMTGSVLADKYGVNVNGGSSNTVNVNGNVTATSGTGTSISFGPGNFITIGGDVTAGGTDSYGALITAGSAGSSIAVGGSVSASGSGIYTSGANISGGGIITVGKDISSANNGAYISGGGTVTVGGSVLATGLGAYISGGGGVEVTGDITVNAVPGSAASGGYIYNYNCPNSTASLTVHGNIAASNDSTSQAFGVSITNHLSAGSAATVTVDGGVSAVSAGGSATGIEIGNDTSGGTAGVTVGGDIGATGVSTVTGINAYGSGWTVTTGAVSASGGTTNTGVGVSGSGTATLDSIAASSYIKTWNSYPETAYSPGGGVLNSSTGYFEYVNGSTVIHVKGWALNVAGGMGGTAGIGGTSVTSGTYEGGTKVSLEAVKTVTEYHFETWTSSAGGTFDSETSASAMFNMPANDTTVTANFINTYNLSYTAGLNGTLSGTTTQTVNYGDSGTQVTATPDAEYHFVNWSDGSTANPRTDSNVTSDLSVTANFAINTCSLSYAASSNGIITGTTTQTVIHGDSGTPVTAVPNAGYHFVDWSDGSTANPRTDSNVADDLSVTASFAINTYGLSYTAGSNGTLSGTATQTVNYGDSGTQVTAVPNTGYHFVDWSDGSTANPRTDSNVADDLSVTANFAINTYNLTYAVGSHGTITGTATQTVNYGDSGTQVTATPDTGYHFVSWNDGSTANPRIDSNVTSDIGVTANFAVNSYNLSYTAGSNGTLSGTATQTVNYGDSGTQITAVPNTGYHFVDWSDGSTANPRTDRNITADIDLNAVFSPNTYTITYNLNGGTNNTGNIAAYIYGVGLTLGAPTKPGYTFAGWYEQGDFSGSAVTAINTTVAGDKLFYAKWTANTGGGGGGSGTSAPTTSVVTKEGTTTATTTASAGVDRSGKATATVTQDQMRTVVSQAAAEATRQGGDKTVVTVRVEAPAAVAVETIIPRESVNEVAAVQTAELAVKTPVATIKFDKGALSTISGETSGDVKITAARVETSALSPEAQQIVGDRPVFNFNVTGGDKTISRFNGNVIVTIPYTPKADEEQEIIVIYYINGKGQPEIVPNSKYDPATGMVTFETTHFSQYAVGYNKVNFSDVSGEAWYSKAVNYVAARGIAAGLGNGQYGPNAKLTRGQFLVMVMKAYVIAADTAPADNFADAGNTYYTGYLAAAKRLGISGGIGKNLYAPEKQITRQEMFTLLYNALNKIGELPAEGPGGKELGDFSDADGVAGWARQAMTLFVGNGTVSGSNGKLNPADTTNRAQMAQVLYNLLAK